MASLTAPELRTLFRFMVATRSVEERLERLFKQGQIVGGLYRSLGQEATAVGSAVALEEGDWLAPSIRDLGALLVRGIAPLDILLQYLARGGSLCAGKDNTNHMTVLEQGVLGPVSPLGTQLCVLNGVALAFKQRGETRVCMTYQGDGASRTGASHEGFAFAAALHLPIVIILEHNRWAFATRSSQEAAVSAWSDVSKAYGIPSIAVDGNDVLAVREAAVEAVARARGGGGPTMIAADTYRMLGHAQHDPQFYVPPNELELWRGRDPIGRFERYLVRHQFETAESLAALRHEVDLELDEAVEAALAEDYPDGQEARTRVYADPEPDITPWTRREPVGYPDLAPAAAAGRGPGGG